ncbi:protein zwilch homolog [Liolophura sinensis]|uniref:protein zwilch homolog n=1 Tax=Liolophura sinensis TaxID=3198878 RepID=UPI003158BD36
MDSKDVIQLSKAIKSLTEQNSLERVVLKDSEISLSVERWADSSGPLGEIAGSLNPTDIVIIAWKHNPNLSTTTTSLSDEVLNSTEIPRDRRKPSESEYCDSVLEGSPLKLVTIADLSAIGGATAVPKSGLPAVRRKRYEALPVNIAQYLLSVYITVQLKQTNGEYLKPLWVLCDGKKPGQIVCLSVCHTALPEGKSNTTLSYTQRTTEVIMTGPHPKSFYTNSLLQNKMAKTRFISCQAEYDVIGSLSKENPMAGLQGSVKLEVEWNGYQQLLQCPPADAHVTAKVQVARGDTKSGGYMLYTELELVRRLIESLTSGEICWAVQESSRPLIDELKAVLGNLAAGDAKRLTFISETCDTTVMQGIEESLELEEREDQDFTDYMWILLKKCSSFAELVDCLELIFSQVKSGKLQPMVNRNNKTGMAQLMRNSYTGGACFFPPLSPGMLPIELLTEMGLEKLTMDYVNAFLAKNLTTPIHLEYFVDRDLKLTEKLERLEKLHCVLELMIILKTFLHTPQATLSACACQTLQYFETNRLDWEKVFSVPVPTQSVAKMLENAPPNIWQCREMRNSGGINEVKIKRLSTEMPFQHLDHPKHSCMFDSSQLDTSATPSEDLEYFQVAIEDSVILL